MTTPLRHISRTWASLGMLRGTRVTFAIALAVAAGTALSGCSGGARKASGPPAVPVTTAIAARKTVPVSVRAIGHVEPIETVGVKARIGGELTQVHFREGQNVRAGDTLFTIDPRQYAAVLRQAEAQLARDQALAKKAEADVARYRELVAKDFVTKEQYDLIVATAGSARASVEADQANVDNARLQLVYCTITSPISGRAGNLLAKAGNLIKANDDKPLVTINQIKPIFASFTVPAQLLPEIAKHNGQKLKVSALLPGEPRPVQGLLTFVDNGVDPTTSTVLLKATFANEDERLWAGQFVDVTLILGEEQDRIVAPAAAVQTGQQGDFVFVVKADRTVDLRVIKIARRDETEAVVESGLAAGETIVTDGQIRLLQGSKVELKSSGAAGSATR
jgi:membrane fusion protein, multidrug efflux system